MPEDDLNKPTSTSDFDRALRQRKELVQEIKTLVIDLENTHPQKLDQVSTLIEQAKSKRNNAKPH